MSGGSYNYAFGYVNDFATELRKDTPERRAFAELLVKVAKAMHDIKWVDFCDYGKGAETVAILACLGRRDISDAALNQVEDALTKALEGVRAARQPQEPTA